MIQLEEGASPKSCGLIARLGLSGSQAEPSQTTWARPGLRLARLLTARLRLSRGSGRTLHNSNPYIHQTLKLFLHRGSGRYPGNRTCRAPAAAHSLLVVRTDRSGYSKVHAPFSNVVPTVTNFVTLVSSHDYYFSFPTLGIAVACLAWHAGYTWNPNPPYVGLHWLCPPDYLQLSFSVCYEWNVCSTFWISVLYM